MDLLAVLISNNGAFGGSRVSSKNDTILKNINIVKENYLSN